MKKNNESEKIGKKIVSGYTGDKPGVSGLLLDSKTNSLGHITRLIQSGSFYVVETTYPKRKVRKHFTLIATDKLSKAKKMFKF